MEQLKSMFEAWAHEACAECLVLGANGSSRQYFRLRSASGKSCIGTIAEDVRENEAFFHFTHHFRNEGMPVPELYVVADDRRHYLQQDLGDQTLYGLLLEKRRQGGGFDNEMLEWYRKALAGLDAMQKAGRNLDFSYGFPRAAFDKRCMLWDLNYFKYYFLKLQHIPFDEDRLQDDFERFADRLLEADCSYFMYRDFQGRNIMLDQSNLYYIDYQGGRRGAAQYDVASLLYSAKSDLPESLRAELLRHYVELHGDPRFMQHYWLYVYMRILQTLGAYGYRGLYERKPYFIESIPLAVNNLRRAQEEHPLPSDLPELSKCLDAIVVKASGQPVSPADRLTVTVQSFSYKQGLPDDPSGNGGGHIFDCRALPNPGRYEQYKAYTGMDRPVIDFLQREPAVGLFLDHAKAIVAQSVDKYVERRFSNLQVSFGCTGGQHRSVYCATQLALWLQENYPDIQVVLRHREQDKK